MNKDRGKQWRKEIRDFSDEELYWELQKETWDWREDVRNEVLCRILGRVICNGQEEISERLSTNNKSVKLQPPDTQNQKGCSQLFDYNKRVCGRLYDGLCPECKKSAESVTEVTK